MQKGTLMSFEEDSPTPLTLSKNSSFDSSFVSMTKFIETTNMESTDGHKILHPQLISRLNKPAYEFIKELGMLVTNNAESNKKNHKLILKLLEDIAPCFSTGMFSGVHLDNPYSSISVSLSAAQQGGSMSPTMNNFFNSLLHLFSIGEKKIYELIHYYISELNLSDAEREQVVRVLKKELAQKDVTSRIFCIRTLDRLVRTDPRRVHSDFLFSIVKENLNEFAMPESFAEKKGLSSLLNVGAKDRKNKLTLLKATIQAIRNNPTFVTCGLEHIINVSRSKDLVCSREAIAALTSIAKNDNQAAVLSALSKYVPSFTIEPSKSKQGFAYSRLNVLKKAELKKSTLLPHFNIEDVYSKFHLCSLAALVIKELKLPTRTDNNYNETERGGAYDEQFTDLLKHLIHDENVLVFFEATKQASLRNFSFFLQKDINQQTGSILDFVVKRLCNSLSKNKPQIQIHAACKTAHHLLMAFAKFTTYCTVDPYASYPPDSAEMRLCKATLLRLYDYIDELLAYDCCFIKFEAFKAALWREDSLESVLKLLKMEVKSNTVWMPTHIHDFVSFICIYLSERIDVDLLIALFKSVIPDKDTPKRHQIASKFLQMLFYILDNCLTGSKESIQLTLTLYSFLGDVANRLTGEPKDGDRDIMSNPNKQKMDPKEIFERPEMFEIQNGAMKAIIIRLAHNSMYNTPQIRTTCTEALAKIAFRSLGAVRLFIYELFQYLAHMPSLGLCAQAMGMIQVLDEVYRLQQEFVKLLYKQQSDKEILEFYEKHELLKKKISFFTRIPPSFLIVGRASQNLLARGYDLKYKSLDYPISLCYMASYS